MFSWFKNRTELQKLQHDYCKMMKNAYKLALTDKKKSDQLHEKANEILSRIKKIESSAIF
ncbi:Lacal_2735 family protein [Aquimarina gracilis]|uniref:Lacal_2735 family protein n=1 Tax=Aquimarina gracilis TaxID=874422 RepID=A0ABU5ZRC3_9FLAO|nr:Lacal_2735 family protein [Aquimarina gracilis]MEB3344610.1 Lacal_2735 family protein [Aquimarina gracilis]